jgi:two-component system, NarL family, response regulator LiaR
MGDAQHIRVMVVDDHDMVRRGLAVFLRAFGDLKLVAEASDGSEALQIVSNARPDVVLMDLIMPGMDGVETTRILRDRYPGTQVIALTSFRDEDLVYSALQAGAIAFLMKNASIEELAAAIRAAHAGKPTLSPEATQALIDRATRPTALTTYHLSDRELEVLSLMAEGLTNHQIAGRLTVSLSTVKFHVSSVLAKLGVSSRTEAVALAMQHNLVG